MKTQFRFSIVLIAMTLVVPATADTIYSNLQDVVIPTDFTGVFIDVDGNSNWDINPFFGGVGVANSAAFQPARLSAGNLGTLANFSVGSVIDAGGMFSTGYGGSQDHLGNTFTAGQEGYLGFKMNGNHGWMRVVFTGNTAGAVVKDWAYDNSGAALVVGRVQQSAAVSGAQTVTLSPGSGESFTLGSLITNTSGNINSVIKTGAGTAILNSAHTYTGTTTISGGVLAINGDQSAATGNVSVSNLGTRLIGTGTIGGDTTINSGAIHSAGGAIANVDRIGKQTFDEIGGATANVTYGEGSIFEWDLNSNKDTDSSGIRGMDYDAVDVSGTLTTSSTAIFRVVLGSSVGVGAGDFWTQTHSWTDIFGGGVSLAGAGFTNSLLQVVDASTGNVYDTSSLNPEFGFTISGTTLNWTVVPEPTSALGGLLLTAGILRRRRLTSK